MHLDAQNLFSDAQALTATAVSTNYIDLGATATPALAPAALKRDIGGNYDIPLLVQVVESFAGGTSVAVAIQMAADSAFTSPQTVATSAAIPVADLKAGYKFSIPTIPPGANLRYMRLNYTVVGVPTGGKITAGIAAGLQTNG